MSGMLLMVNDSAHSSEQEEYDAVKETCVRVHAMFALQDKTSDELRGAAAGLLASICKAGGAVLWSSTGYYAEDALKISIAALEDAASVRK